MANTVKIPRSWLVMGFCLPLAILLGYFLAEPLEASSLAVVVLVLTVLSVPLMMKWHHPLLVLSWNAMVAPIFLPGKLDLWVMVALASFFFAGVNRSVDPYRKFSSVRGINKAMLFFTAVVVITALSTGGFGFRAMGSAQYGGKRYLYVFAAIAGYYALTSQRIPIQRLGVGLGMFFLPGITAVIGNLAVVAGPAFYFVLVFFPANVQDPDAGFARFEATVERLGSVSVAAAAIYGYMLSRFGLRGVLEVTKPWRFLVFFLTFLGCLAGGFRSSVILFGLIVTFLFFLEGLHRTRLLPISIAVTLLSAVVVLPQVYRLPLPLQRAISFLPARVNPTIAINSHSSTEWRTEMWKAMLPEIPKYLFKGKGYALDPDEMFRETENAYHGVPGTFGGAMAAGDYHSGPLSVLIPFGLFGSVAFLWLLGAGVRTLYNYYRYGNPELRNANTFFLALFIAKAMLFFFVFGLIYSDLVGFTGLLGLAVSLNGPVPEKFETPGEEAVTEPFPEEYQISHRR